MVEELSSFPDVWGLPPLLREMFSLTPSPCPFPTQTATHNPATSYSPTTSFSSATPLPMPPLSFLPIPAPTPPLPSEVDKKIFTSAYSDYQFCESEQFSCRPEFDHGNYTGDIPSNYANRVSDTYSNDIQSNCADDVMGDNLVKTETMEQNLPTATILSTTQTVIIPRTSYTSSLPKVLSPTPMTDTHLPLLSPINLPVPNIESVMSISLLRPKVTRETDLFRTPTKSSIRPSEPTTF